MKFLHSNKIRIIYLLFSIVFVFKVFSIQEYIHLEQHKVNKISHDHCQQCHTIFHLGKYQLFDVAEDPTFILPHHSEIINHPEDIYTFIFHKNINKSNYFNRPPPIFS